MAAHTSRSQPPVTRGTRRDIRSAIESCIRRTPIFPRPSYSRTPIKRAYSLSCTPTHCHTWSYEEKYHVHPPIPENPMFHRPHKHVRTLCRPTHNACDNVNTSSNSAFPLMRYDSR